MDLSTPLSIYTAVQDSPSRSIQRRVMSNNDSSTAAAAAAAADLQSFPMNGGDGPNSYLNNSSLQRQAANASRSMVEEAIAESLDVNRFSSNPFRLADLGCSVGPNTFMAMQHILEALERKYAEQGHQYQIPEFQIFFNDHSSNDFNTLFVSLPAERRYFACGVPGSFHGRLFPEASIHFMHSSYALQWLSKVPEDLLDKKSPAWNRGRIHYIGAPDEVSQAYAAQFEYDMEIFLSARAKELVVGGMMVLIMPALQDGIPASRTPSGFMFDLLGACLMDMAKEGLIREDEVDSFNLPVYAATGEQIRVLVKRNKLLSIERMEIVYPAASKHGGLITGKEYGMHLRAGMEGILTQHFGSGIIDELFNRFSNKTVEFSLHLESSREQGTQLFVVLSRK